MRQLTAKQKKVLDKFIISQTVPVEDRWMNNDAPFKNSCFVLDIEDSLPPEIMDELEKINDTEILFQEVNRYLSGKSFEMK